MNYLFIIHISIFLLYHRSLWKSTVYNYLMFPTKRKIGCVPYARSRRYVSSVSTFPTCPLRRNARPAPLAGPAGGRRCWGWGRPSRRTERKVAISICGAEVPALLPDSQKPGRCQPGCPCALAPRAALFSFSAGRAV